MDRFFNHCLLQAHVLKTSSALYSAVLGAVNIQDGKNSYYKLQILEHDKKPKWWVLNKGRSLVNINLPQVGLPLMGSCGHHNRRNQAWGKFWPWFFQDQYHSLWNQEFESKHDAQRDFEFQYEDKTGNKWKNRDNFQKVVFGLNQHLLYSFRVGRA